MRVNDAGSGALTAGAGSTGAAVSGADVAGGAGVNPRRATDMRGLTLARERASRPEGDEPLALGRPQGLEHLWTTPLGRVGEGGDGCTVGGGVVEGDDGVDDGADDGAAAVMYVDDISVQSCTP